jgi:hypothetical protein
MRRTIRLTGLAAILLLNFSGLAVAHLGETPDHVKERLGKPTEILGSDGVSVPAPADEDDLKSIVSRDHQCLARTNDPLTLFIENFRFFAYEATAASRSGK